VQLRDDANRAVHELLAPDLFPTEIANALLVAERRGRLTAGEGARLLADVFKTPIHLHAAVALLPRAYAIALAHQRSVYDCLYVALAEREACQMVTADDKLVKGLQSSFPFIVALASLP
jgi:predicted nucleic acid-binding protein